MLVLAVSELKRLQLLPAALTCIDHSAVTTAKHIRLGFYRDRGNRYAEPLLATQSPNGRIADTDAQQLVAGERRLGKASHTRT